MCGPRGGIAVCSGAEAPPAGVAQEATLSWQALLWSAAMWQLAERRVIAADRVQTPGIGQSLSPQVASRSAHCRSCGPRPRAHRRPLVGINCWAQRQPASSLETGRPIIFNFQMLPRRHLQDGATGPRTRFIPSRHAPAKAAERCTSPESPRTSLDRRSHRRWQARGAHAPRPEP